MVVGPKDINQNKRDVGIGRKKPIINQLMKFLPFFFAIKAVNNAGIHSRISIIIISIKLGPILHLALIYRKLPK